MSGDDKDPPSLDSRWAALAALTPARIGLGRAGASLPTRELLRFGLAHAQARDAVHIPFRAQEVAEALAALGPVVLQVESAASSRELYLRRPDLGRRLSPASRAVLAGQHPAVDLAIVVGDGLSSTAIHQNAARFLGVLLPALQRRGVTLAPVVVASQARVALGDEIGASLQARAVVMLIGERPGLSSPDSLGLYLTFGPRVGLTDAARNCISNVRPGGLSDARAASTLAWLLDEALRRGLSGVALKDESGRALVGAEAAAGVLTAP